MTEDAKNKMCYSKKTFSRHKANQRIYYWQSHGINFRKYVCPICKKWHLTSQVGSKSEVLEQKGVVA